MRVAEGGESRGLSAHALDKLLLTCYTVLIVAELRFADEVETLLGLAPYFVEAISSQERIGDDIRTAVASISKIADFHSGAEGSSDELKRGRNRLGPNYNPCDSEVRPRFVSDKPMSLNEIDSEFSETVTIGITIEDRPENQPEIRKAGHGGIGRTVVP